MKVFHSSGCYHYFGCYDYLKITTTVRATVGCAWTVFVYGTYINTPWNTTTEHFNLEKCPN